MSDTGTICPSLGNPSRSHRALSLEDILRVIFKHTDPFEDRVYALVSRVWVEPALDNAWWSVENAARLFALLFPLVRCSRWPRSGCPYHFVGRIVSPNWDRLRFYSKRVRHLKLDAILGVGSTILDEISQTWPSKVHPFPRLKSVQSISALPDNYPTDLRHIALFLHCGVANLTIRCNNIQSQEQAHALLIDIGRLTPALKRLSFVVHHEEPKMYASGVGRLIGSLTGLEHLVIASCLFTPDLFTEVLSLPCLETFGLHHHHQRNHHPRQHEHTLYSCGFGGLAAINRVPESGSHAGPDFLDASGLGGPSRLRVMMLQGRISSFNALFQRRTPFYHLTSLSIDLISINTAESIHTAIFHISSSCSNLESLYITRDEPIGVLASHLLEDERSPVTIDALIPLTALSQLVSFKLTHSQPVTVQDDELVSWIVQCNKLRRLHLSPSPLSPDAPMSLTLGVLVAIRRVRPEMESLCLYLDVTPTLRHWNSPSQAAMSDPAIGLRSICFGLSPIHSQGDSEVINRLVRFLRDFLPKGCRIECVVRVKGDHDDLVTLETVANHPADWMRRRQVGWAIVNERVSGVTN